MKLATIGVMGLAISWQQPILSFRSPSGAFTLENFANLTYAPGTLHGEVTGASFRARWRDRGLELTGQNAVIDAGKDAKSDYYLTSASVSGQAAIVQDSKAGYEYATEAAKTEGVTLPPMSVDQARLSLSSDRFNYAGDQAQGTITLPVAFTMARQAHMVATKTVAKKKVPYVADDSVEFHGSSGLIQFSYPTAGVNSLRMGNVQGPITVQFVRKSTTDGKPDADTKLDGTADRMDLDFVSPVHTITLTGNVTMNGTSNPYSGFTKASKAVIVFGADGKIERIDMSGNPTDTVIKTHPTKLGGGS